MFAIEVSSSLRRPTYTEREMFEIIKPVRKYGKKPSSFNFLPESCLKVNLCGSRFSIPLKYLRYRCPNSLLSRFAAKDHDEKLKMCDGYTPEKDEYIFLQSPFLFDVVFRYYISGVLHKPSHMCLEQFREVLDFWNLPSECADRCCFKGLKASREQSDIEEIIKDEGEQLAKELDTLADEYEGKPLANVRFFVWKLFEIPETSIFARVIYFFSIIMILLSVGEIILGSIPEFLVPVYGNYSNTTNITEYVMHPSLQTINTVCSVWFSLEYLIRLFAVSNRCKFAKDALNVIDLVAIAPFYLHTVLNIFGPGGDSVGSWKNTFLVMRVLRAMRVVRVFKLARYNMLLIMFMRSMRRSSSQLQMSFMLTTTAVIFFSTMVYFLEKDQPDTKFYSIPAGFWWCLGTISTVGYGDMYPQTFRKLIFTYSYDDFTVLVGKIAGSAAIVCGRLIMSLPLTIVVNNFASVIKEIETRESMHWSERKGHIMDQRSMSSIASRSSNSSL